jgi:phosphonate transport system ATP-binding protein
MILGSELGARSSAIRACAIRATGLAKIYPGGTVGLRGLSVEVEPGELVGLLGPSGSGKTTLFRLFGGALRPSCGQLEVLGRDLGRIRADELRYLRRRLGIIYQQHNLVPRLSAASNVLLGRLGQRPLWQALLGALWLPSADLRDAFAALQEVEIGDKLLSRVDDLSGGQQQRVAVARALLGRPELILADEPVASVDARTAELMLTLFARLNREQGTTVVVSLHQADLARRFCRRVLVLANGQITYDGPPDSAQEGW